VKTGSIENIGPITRVQVPAPEEGGIVLFRGRNGSGKTHSLEAVAAATSKSAAGLNIRDGQRAGEVSAFGVTIKVGRSTRRSGELEVETIDGRLDLGKLISPGFDKGEANDARRIKQLVHLANVDPDPSLFYEALGGRDAYREIASEVTTESEDVVQMAERIKRDCERCARKAADSAKLHEGAASAERLGYEKYDLTAPSDSDELQAALEAAIRAESALSESARAHAADETAKAKAREQLALIESQYAGLTPEEASAKVDAATAQERAADKKAGEAHAAVRAAELALAEAKMLLQQATAAHDAAVAEQSLAIEQKTAATRNAELVAELRRSIESTSRPAVSLDEATAAKDAVLKARQAVERGALIRAALVHKFNEEESKRKAKEAAERGAALREAAAAVVDDVLSKVVNRSTDKLRVEKGRLVCDTVRGVTLFDELSPGERTWVAFEIAAAAFSAEGKQPILVMSQECWEGLDPENRRAADQIARERRILVYTAECSDDDDVTAEVYAGE